jgi:hypothetical protein
VETAAAESPLIALVWVFAVSAGILGALTISALALAYRHRHRRRTGVYTEILATSQSSRVSFVLTVGDLLMDTHLRDEIRRKLVREAHAQEAHAQEAHAQEAHAQEAHAQEAHAQEAHAGVKP